MKPFRAAIVLALPALFPVHAQDAAAKSREARRLLGERRFDDAIRLYRELIAVQPANPGWKLNLGVAQHMAERDREAVATLAEVLRVEPNHGPALVMSGGSLLRLGEAARAAALLERASRVMPGDLEVTRMLADAHSMSGHFAPAAAALRKLAAGGGDAQLWAKLGRTYEALAEEAFASLDRRAPGSAHWLALIAETRMKQNRMGAALTLLREASAKLNRRDWHEAAAAIYEQTGHADWAAVERTAAQRLPSPACAAPSAECSFRAGRHVEAAGFPGQTADAFYWRAKAYNELARDAFENLSKYPDSASWHAFLAGLHRNRGKYEDSIAEWRAAIALQSGDDGLERELAGTLLAARRYEEAEAAARGLAGKSPGDAELQWILGEALVAQQKHADALKPLAEAVRLDSKRLAARASLGRALQATGRSADAIPHLRAALPTDRDGALHFQLSRALAASGLEQEAAVLARKSQELRRAAAEAPDSGITPP